MMVFPLSLAFSPQVIYHTPEGERVKKLPLPFIEGDHYFFSWEKAEAYAKEHYKCEHRLAVDGDP